MIRIDTRSTTAAAEIVLFVHEQVHRVLSHSFVLNINAGYTWYIHIFIRTWSRLLWLHVCFLSNGYSSSVRENRMDDYYQSDHLSEVLRSLMLWICLPLPRHLGENQPHDHYQSDSRIAFIRVLPLLCPVNLIEAISWTTEKSSHNLRIYKYPPMCSYWYLCGWTTGCLNEYPIVTRLTSAKYGVDSFRAYVMWASWSASSDMLYKNVYIYRTWCTRINTSTTTETSTAKALSTGHPHKIDIHSRFFRTVCSLLVQQVVNLRQVVPLVSTRLVSFLK